MSEAEGYPYPGLPAADNELFHRRFILLNSSREASYKITIFGKMPELR
jgi:hypothetical protein